jgi:flagella basal body P-ring formation protein FlgA
MRKRYQLLTVNLILFAALGRVHALERTLTLKPKLETHTHQFCLSELFNEPWLQGRCISNRADCCSGRISSGKSQVLSIQEIQQWLKSVTQDDIDFKIIGEEVEVIQTRRALTRQELIAAAQVQVSESANFAEKNCKVKDVKITREVYVPVGEAKSWRLIFPEQATPSIHVRIVDVRNMEVVFGWAQVELSQMGDGYVAKQDISLGAPISPALFSKARIDLLEVGIGKDALVLTEEQFQNARAQRFIKSGTILRKELLGRIPIVNLGDNVTIVLRSDNIRISTKGITQGAAAEGEMVTVQLKRYSRSFRGKVNSDRSVEVWL